MSLITSIISLPMIAPLIAAGAMPALMKGASSMIGGLMGGFMARKARRDAEKKRQAIDARLQNLEANRQEIINPYAQAMQMVTNPFANLQVATQGAQFQAEQADVSLANTLDTLRATGAGAGGATALARAAVQSKQGVAASIEQQEARNAQLRAQGQAAQEKQLAAMSGAGEQFMFQAQEARELQQLNRLSSLSSSYSQQEAAYRSQESKMFSSALGGAASAGMSFMGSGKNNNDTPPGNGDEVEGGGKVEVIPYKMVGGKLTSKKDSGLSDEEWAALPEEE